jgi:hypothetical protein
MADSFPNSLDFSPNPMSIAARAYYSKCVPESSSEANPGSTVRIRIPSGRAGSYLNPHKSYLSFVVENKTSVASLNALGTAAACTIDANGLAHAQLRLDGSAYSVIQTQEIYNSSNLLESIQNANVLYNILCDLQTNMISRHTAGTILGSGNTGVNSSYYDMYRRATLVDNTEAGAASSMNFIQGAEFITGQNLYAGSNIISFPDFNVYDTADPPVLIGTTNPDAGQAEGVIGVPVYNLATDPPNQNNIPLQNRIGPVSGNLPIPYSGTANTLQVVANNQSTYQRGANFVNAYISRAGPVIPYNGRCRFCLPLCSGIIGTQACKLFPLHALNSDLQLHLILASNESAICNNYIPTHWSVGSVPVAGVSNVAGAVIDGNNNLNPQYSLSNIEFVANIVEVSAAASAMLDQATGGQYVLPSTSYRNYEYSLPQGSLTNEFMVPARFTSIKSIMACQRPSASLNRTDRFSLTSRIKNFATSIQYRVGSLLVPQEKIKMENIGTSLGTFSGKAPDAFCHILECLGQSVSDSNINCCLDDHIYGANHDTADYDYGNPNNNHVEMVNIPDRVATFAQNSSTLGQTDQRYYERLGGSTAGFVWGIDLESFSNSGCNSPMNSGTNTLGLNIMCRISCDNTSTTIGDVVSSDKDIVAVQVDHYVHFDQVCVVSGGVASVRF